MGNMMSDIVCSLRFILLVLCSVYGLSFYALPVLAQSVIATVNDDPITDVDISQHMKLLSVLKKPATRDAAIENIIATRLKLIEGSKYKISLGDRDIGPTIGQIARKMGIQPQALLINLQHAGVTEDQWKQYFKAETSWGLYVKALNKTLEISESELNEAMQKQGRTITAAVTEYNLRQVIMIVPNNANESILEARMREAAQLRQRFTDCNEGVNLARSMNDVAVKEPMSRMSTALNEALRNLLDSTAVGHLTPPQRGQAGIEMIALCSKNTVNDKNSATEDLRYDLLSAKMEKESARLFAEVRARAVIVKRK
jgi:peptidyl-prolyl cis-trans isomerase SurA